MSVWPDGASAGPSLASSEGTLVSVSISVNPRDLESLLEALAQVEFPVNPQIYHEAAMVYRYGDGHEEAEATTLVEFPAYAGGLGEVRRALEAFGFDAAMIEATSMLEEIHSASRREAAPPGARYQYRLRKKFRAAEAH